MNADLLRALKENNELELTVKGRKTGKASARPVWFVPSKDGKSLLLIPVNGRRTQWYLNVKKEPRVTIKVGGQSFTGSISELSSGQLDQVVEAFRAKYGRDMERWYPNLEVALAIPLPDGA